MKNIGMILVMFILIVPAVITAETTFEKDLNQFLAEKKALVKEVMRLTEKEKEVFWPLYDDYEKNQVNSYRQWTEFVQRYLREREKLSDKSAKEMITKMLELQAKDFEIKRKYVKKFSEKLAHKIVFKYFIFEERIEAGLDAFLAEELPPIK